MDNQQERREAAIYVAAMIQGEGSVMAYINKGGRSGHSISIGAKVVIYNTDQAVVERILDACRVLGTNPHVYGYPQKLGDKKKSMRYVVIMGYKRLTIFLPWVIPFLVSEKAWRAQLLFELSKKRATLPKTAPYEKSDIETLRSVFNTGKFLESSTTIRLAPTSGR